MKRDTYIRLEKIRKNLLGFIFGDRCACCGEIIEMGKSVCNKCAEQLKYRVEGCSKCGNPKDSCLCKNRQYEFDGIYSPYLYKGPAREGVLRMKADTGAPTAEFFGDIIGQMLIEKGISEKIDLIVCVPLTKEREREKGYNQSHLLAKRISRHLDLPYEKKGLKKLYNNKCQHTCNALYRIGNVFGVYEADRELCSGKNILIVDDVSTGRSTLNECAKMLKIAGALDVYCAVATINS